MVVNRYFTLHNTHTNLSAPKYILLFKKEKMIECVKTVSGVYMCVSMILDVQMHNQFLNELFLGISFSTLFQPFYVETFNIEF